MKTRWLAAALATILCLSPLPCGPAAAKEETPTTSPAMETLRGWGFTLDDATLNKAAKQLAAGSDLQSLDPASLLLLLGLGQLDFETGEWEPVSRDVYIFDAEVMFIDRMYTNILTGIDAIVPDIEITEIAEDLSGLTDEMAPDRRYPWMMSDGKRSVSFLCNGHPYSVELTSLGDWVNADFFDFMDKVLAQENCPFCLYQMTVLAQFIAMVYGPEERAEQVYGVLGPF